MNLIIKPILLIFSVYSYSLTIIDVRTPEEWNTGYLQSAINVEWQNITSIESLISKDEEIYLYCRSGNRSSKATKALTEAGFVNVTNAGSIQEASLLLDINIIN